MRLDHINLTVKDVLAARAFLQKYFGCTDMFEDNSADMSVLDAGHGMHINLMRGAKTDYPKMFHIGFDLETETAVSAFHQRLTSDGFEIKPPKHAWGSWTFHFICPGSDFTIEVACTAAESSYENQNKPM